MLGSYPLGVIIFEWLRLNLEYVDTFAFCKCFPYSKKLKNVKRVCPKRKIKGQKE